MAILSAEQLLAQYKAQGGTPLSFSQLSGGANDGTGTYATPTQTQNVISAYQAGGSQPLTTAQIGAAMGSTNIAPEPITTSSLAPTSPYPVVSPTDTAPYPVAGLDSTTPPLTATPQEEKASSLTSKLGGLYDSLVGKSAYTTQMENQYGIPELSKTQTDLSSQLKALQNEAAAIPLQLMQGASDRGVTTPVLGRQENSRLRTNAIAALGVSTLLEASRGNLTTALSLVDRAVAQKYDPILEQIAATKANLELIFNDPLTSLQDKNRAQVQMDLQNQKQQATTLAKQNETEVWNIATTAASNGQNFKPIGQYTSLALTLQAISQAPTKEQALQIASATGLISGGTETSTGGKILGSASSGYYTYDPATGQTTPIANPNPISPTGGSIPSIPSSEVTSLKNALNASKFAGPEADGKYADPSLYLANYQSFLDSGGSADVFFRYFPPTTYINPANTWLPEEIMRFVKKPASSTTGDTGIINPFQ